MRPTFDVTDPAQIVLAVRWEYEQHFIDALHKDDREQMRSLYTALDALTEAYWCVWQKTLP
jgi:hypothetical protein